MKNRMLDPWDKTVPWNASDEFPWNGTSKYNDWYNLRLDKMVKQETSTNGKLVDFKGEAFKQTQFIL